MSVHILFGGAGFIGKELINSFDQEDKIFIIDLENKNLEVPSIFSERLENITLINLDLSQEFLFDLNDGYHLKITPLISQINKGFKKLHIYHLASPVGVINHSVPTFYKAMAINQNVFNFCKYLGVYLNTNSGESNKSLFFNYTSSSELYGGLDNDLQKTKIILNSFFDPHEKDGGYRSDYIYQKALGEMLFLQLDEFYKVNIFRLFNIVGKFQDPNKGVFNKFIKEIYHGEQSIVTKSIRCYTSSKTMCEIINNQNKDIYALVANTTDIVDPKFRTSMTAEELYLYIYAYINSKFKPVEPNYKISKIPNEILIRGSSDTLSYSNFCTEFGYIIENVYKILDEATEDTVENIMGDINEKY